MNHSLFTLMFLLSAFVFAEPAFAYLDPGSGSMMLQLLLGGIAGIAVIIKLYWNSFMNFFRHKRGQNEDSPSKNGIHE